MRILAQLIGGGYEGEKESEWNGEKERVEGEVE